VTCLCLTKNRRVWLPKAIQCFQQQSYPQIELLILADGEDVKDLVPDDDRIRLIHLEESRKIGEKRNFGCQQAGGEVICHWDDDDWSGPGRITRQIEMMEASGKAVAGFHSMRFTDGANWWAYLGTKNYAIGTSLCYRRDWWQAHKFSHANVGEDNDFVAAAANARQLVNEDAGDLMHATIHAGNTSPRMIANNWKKL
jgi:glycosyltransferase involved in cell wall biosynthesis